MRKPHPLISLSLFIFLVISSCVKSPEFAQNESLEWSNDTVYFDTIFTRQSQTGNYPISVTKILSVKNPSALWVNANFEVAGGDQSSYKINVDGLSGSKINNIEIPINISTKVTPAIDEFFYTIVYAILVYLIGTSSFKMIDHIPQSIIRWAGSGAKSFGDQDGDPTADLVRYAAFGGANIANQASGIASQGAELGGKATGGILGLATKFGGSSTKAAGTPAPTIKTPKGP